MNKAFCLLVVLSIGTLFLGCNESKRYYSSTVAPVSTVTVVLFGEFPHDDSEEITHVVNNIYNNIVNDYSVTNNVSVHVTTNIEGDIKVNGNKFLCLPGDENECPGLYEAICVELLGDDHPDAPKWKNKGKQMEDDHKRNRKGK